MRLYLPTVILVAVILIFTARASATTCAPAQLVHITIANVTRGIDPTSFAAQPKNYYRTGGDKLRIEEAVDAANGIHGVIVVAEPNIWMANLYDGTGKHIVDPGPTFFAKAPIFGTKLSGKLIGLEFGCEAYFIAANAPKPVHVEQVGGIGFDVYRIEDGPDAVEILERSGTNIPAFARYFHQDNLAAVLRYDLYLTNLPSDPSLFLPPPNVRYTEAGTQAVPSTQPSALPSISPVWKVAPPPDKSRSRTR